MWVRAKAMFSVPRVTMNAGSRAIVTRPPLIAPNAAHTATPMRIASGAGTSPPTARRVITIVPNAITAPLDRSMPAVRITTVWPTASVPSSITCWTTRDRLPPVRNRSVLSEKNTQASRRATRGPTVGTAALIRAGRAGASGVSVTGAPPAVGEAERDVLGRQALLRFGGDQVDAGVGVAGRLLAAARPRDDGVHALRGHLQRVLLGGRGDLPGLYGLDARAPAVDRHDHRGGGAAGRLERGVGPERRRLVDRVDEVDAGLLLQAVLHRGLALGLVAGGVLGAGDARVAVLDPVALQEAVVAEHADGDAGVQVEHGDLDRLAALDALGVLADEDAGREVVRGEQRVGGALRVRWGVQGDDVDALGARLGQAGHDRRGVARHDEDALDPGGDHVLHRGDLAGVVAVELARRGHQLAALGLGLLLGALLHLDG